MSKLFTILLVVLGHSLSGLAAEKCLQKMNSEVGSLVGKTLITQKIAIGWNDFEQQEKAVKTERNIILAVRRNLEKEQMSNSELSTEDRQNLRRENEKYLRLMETVCRAKTINTQIPTELKKYASLCQKFERQYNYLYDEDFYMLNKKGKNFNSITYGKNFKFYSDATQIKGYEYSIGNNSVIVKYDANCSATHVITVEKIESAELYRYFTPQFCKNLSEIEIFKQELPTDKDPNLYHFKCEEQGADRETCKCSFGKYINPWVESCFPIRKNPKITAMDKLNSFAAKHDSIIGAFNTRTNYEKAKQFCNTTMKKLVPSASDSNNFKPKSFENKVNQ